MALDKILTHEERITTEKEATDRNDMNSPTEDEGWDNLEIQLERVKQAKNERGKCAEVIELKQTG